MVKELIASMLAVTKPITDILSRYFSNGYKELNKDGYVIIIINKDGLAAFCCEKEDLIDTFKDSILSIEHKNCTIPNCRCKGGDNVLRTQEDYMNAMVDEIPPFETPLEKLKRLKTEALADEDYEKAAQLRDQIKNYKPDEDKNNK